MIVIHATLNCVIFSFVGRQLPNVDNNCNKKIKRHSRFLCDSYHTVQSLKKLPVDPSSDFEISEESADDDDEDPAVEIASSVLFIFVSGEVDILRLKKIDVV